MFLITEERRITLYFGNLISNQCEEEDFFGKVVSNYRREEGRIYFGEVSNYRRDGGRCH